MIGLRMSGIAKRFGSTEALAGVDLEDQSGEILALVGENGAGKSTLMKVLSGAIAADAGSMTLGGEPYAPRTPAEAHARGVAMIYQELSLAPHLSVEENIVLGVEPSRFGWLDRAGTAGNAAAVGYCFGGRVSFVANSAVPLKAAVSYYGGHIPPLLGRAPQLSGPMLFFWGGLDHHIPEEQRDAARKVRELLASYRQSEDLINLGAYVSGSNTGIDSAIKVRPRIMEFLKQPPDLAEPIEKTLSQLYALAADASEPRP
jgi:ABC-type sugar transport system ATPase subunit